MQWMSHQIDCGQFLALCQEVGVAYIPHQGFYYGRDGSIEFTQVVNLMKQTISSQK